MALAVMVDIQYRSQVYMINQSIARKQQEERRRTLKYESWSLRIRPAAQQTSSVLFSMPHPHSRIGSMLVVGEKPETR
jgi:hypothetical protein